MKSLVTGILFTLFSGVLAAQEQQIQASYFVLFNFSEKEMTDPSGTVTLSPLELTHVVEIDIPSARIGSVIVDWGTDEAHWLFRRTFPVAYPDSTQPGHGVGLLPVTAEEAAILKAHKDLVVRLSYFNTQGVYAGHTLQQGIDAQNIGTGQVTRAGKCIAVWNEKKIKHQAVLAPGYALPAR
ncbi:MAG: hypothetical protein ICV83_08895 [Cytophagales bacterium]|nr:hypothetical protein [Cytophagales bacterium]